MKKTITRVLAVLIAVAMLASLAACGGNGTSSTPTESSKAPVSSKANESSTASVASTADPSGEDGPLTPYAEPITISTGMQVAAVQQFFDGDTYEDNVWTRKIKEELNIDVEIAFSADISTDAYRNKVNALLASEDLPDILRFDNHTFFKQACEGGYAADITDVYNTYATDEVKAWQELYPGGFDGLTIDGKLYAYPYMMDNFHQGINLWIRDDWLENTKSEVPTTIEELTALAKKFTFEDPDGDGANDTYGMGLAGDVLQNNYGTLLGLFQAYGVPGFTSTGTFYRDDDGKMTFAYLNPNCKEALKVANQWYTEGLVDPEFVVKDVANMEADVTNGTLGMMYHACWGTWHPFNLSYQNEGVITRPYPIPTAEGYERRVGINSNETGEYFMVNSKCEHPEAAIKILNLYEKVAISGTPEEFDTYWANEQYRFCPIFIGIPTELWVHDVQAALKAGSPDGLGGTALANYNYVVGFDAGKGELKDDTNAYGTWGQLGLEGSMTIDLDYQSAGEDVVNVMGGDIPDIWVQNSSVLGDMVLQEFTDIIKGDKPVDHFDQFVTEWLAAGGQETLDELDKMYPAE